MKELIFVNIKCGYHFHQIFLQKKFNSIFIEYGNMKGEQVSISKFSIKILTLRTWINNDNTTFKAYCHAGREESSITIFILLLLLTNTLSQWINLHQVQSGETRFIFLTAWSGSLDISICLIIHVKITDYKVCNISNIIEKINCIRHLI